MSENRDSKQDNEITELKTNFKWMREKLLLIEKMVINDIPHQIQELKDEFHKFKLSNSKWLISILVALLFVLIGLIINLIK